MSTLYINRYAKEDDFPLEIKNLIKSISIPEFDRYDRRTFHKTLPPLADLYPNDPAAAAKHLYAHFCNVMKMWGSNPSGEIFLYAPAEDSRSWKIMWESGPDYWAENIYMSCDGWYLDADSEYCVIFVAK